MRLFILPLFHYNHFVISAMHKLNIPAITKRTAIAKSFLSTLSLKKSFIPATPLVYIYAQFWQAIIYFEN